MSDVSVEDVGKGVRWRGRNRTVNKTEGGDQMFTQRLTGTKKKYLSLTKVSLPRVLMSKDIHECQH